jgi:hypothetical protein
MRRRKDQRPNPALFVMKDLLVKANVSGKYYGAYP